jgi:hypothetical protein
MAESGKLYGSAWWGAAADFQAELDASIDLMEQTNLVLCYFTLRLCAERF